MDATKALLKDLYERIPRRHSSDNVKEILAILSEYETVLTTIEALNPYYEKNTAGFFEDLEKVKLSVRKSTDNKASKKNKDDYFAEGSGALKESIDAMMQVYGDGSRTE